MKFEKGEKVVMLPAGAYIIGDPCYNVPDAQWDRVLNESDFFGGQCWATFERESGGEGLVVAFNTAHGDGTYVDGAGRKYGVDAGLIGIIPAIDIDPSKFDPELAHLVQFDSPVFCRERDGVITFGFVDIDTGSDIEDDFNDEDDFDSDPEWNASLGHGE